MHFGRIAKLPLLVFAQQKSGNIEECDFKAVQLKYST